MAKKPEPAPETRGADLDLKYRPRTLDEVRGQPAAVAAVRGFGASVPRALLLHGTTGCGKTTLARIIAAQVGIVGRDLVEVNCGTLESPITWVREVKSQATMSAMKTGGRIGWIMDEAQTLSRQRGAQEALLKILEDSLPHVSFFICTTDPQRLLPAVRGRCVEIAVRPLAERELAELIHAVAAAEGVLLHADVRDAVVAAAEGSARNALKALEKVIGIADPEEAARALGHGFGSSPEAFALVKAVLPWSGNPQWTDALKSLNELKDAEGDPEGLRRMLLASARAQLMKPATAPARAGWACKIIVALREPLFDKTTGWPLLCAYLYEAFHSK